MIAPDDPWLIAVDNWLITGKSLANHWQIMVNDDYNTSGSLLRSDVNHDYKVCLILLNYSFAIA